MDQNKKRFYYLFIFLVVLLGLGVRFFTLGQFTHVDDLAVINDMNQDFNLNRYQNEFLHNESYKNYNTARFEVLRKIDNTGFFDMIESVVNHNPFRFVKVFFTMTYAPLQFFITQWFVNESFSYTTQIVFARLPSLLISLGAIVLYFFTLRKYTPKEERIPKMLLGITVLWLSWNFIINSTLTYPYAAGVTALFGLMFLLFKESERKRNLKGSLWVVVLLLGLVGLQYQLVVFLPAFFLCLLYKYKDQWKGELKHIVVIAIIFGILFMPIFFLKVSGVQAIHWNAGPNNEFVAPEKISELPLFFVENGFIVFMNLASFTYEFSGWLIVLNMFLLVCMFAGGYSLWRNKNKYQKWIGLFVLASFLTWIVLIMLHKIALSPTRHSLILLPFLIITIPEGFMYLAEKIKIRSIKEWGTPVVSIAIVILFLSSMSEIVNNRQDVIKESEVLEQIEGIDIVLEDGMSLNLHLMPSVKQMFTYDKECSCWRNGDQEKNVAFVSTRDYTPERKAALMKQAGLDFAEYMLVSEWGKEKPASFEFSRRVIIGENKVMIEKYEKINKEEKEIEMS